MCWKRSLAKLLLNSHEMSFQKYHPLLQDCNLILGVIVEVSMTLLLLILAKVGTTLLLPVLSLHALLTLPELVSVLSLQALALFWVELLPECCGECFPRYCWPVCADS
jgi:CBS domain containing-hemolysin-like protein